MQKLFEVKMKPKTIMERARRQKISTGVDSVLTSGNDSEIRENQIIKRAKDGTFRGGSREGAGRPPKFTVIEPVH